MLKKNKLQIILSSLVILLPVLFGVILWDELPAMMTTHWGADGNADGFSGKAFAVFGLPLILLALHFICLLFTLFDKKQRDQGPKALGMIFWIIPLLSLFTNGIMYYAAFGKAFDLSLLIPAPIGLMFIFMGNYLPKIKQNRTMGIKISWTLYNEENWNKTHRFGGKVWVVGGLLLLFSIFLPLAAMIRLTVCVIILTVILPVIYSYSIYRQHQKEGIVYFVPPKSKKEKIAVRTSAVVLALFLIGIAVLMFTGNIEVQPGENSFTIEATYWTDLEVDYSEIKTIAYREDLDVGLRTSGFGSARLSMGIFQNEEFGPYTLYAYTGAEAFLVLTSEEDTLVIGMADPEDTQELYDTIAEKIAE